ncbi:hypothetical protein SEVIR_1G012351v4 [Setaria viridis]
MGLQEVAGEPARGGHGRRAGQQRGQPPHESRNCPSPPLPRPPGPQHLSPLCSISPRPLLHRIASLPLAFLSLALPPSCVPEARGRRRRREPRRRLGIVAEHLGSQLQLYLAYCCLILVELWSLSRMKVFVGYSRV